MPFRPAPVPTVFVFAGLFILVNLGAWQYRRHGQTQARLAEVKERTEGARLDNTALARAPQELSWYQADLVGRFSADAPLLITNRYEFNQAGYEVVQRFEPDGAEPILVSRGWLPREDLEAELAKLTVSDTTTVQGMLLDLDYFRDEEGSSIRKFFLGVGLSVPQERAPLPPKDGRPELWMPGSYAVMADRLEPTPELLLVEGRPLKPGERKRPEPLPVRGYHARPKASPHLQYMGTWWLIAATLLVIWIATGFRRGQLLEDAG